MAVRSFFTRKQVHRARRSQRSQRARITPRQSRMAHRHTLKKKGGERNRRKSKKSRKSRKIHGGGIGETHQEVEGIPVGDKVVVASPSGVRSLSEFMAHQDREETEDI